jgi:hypothetical protein
MLTPSGATLWWTESSPIVVDAGPVVGGGYVFFDSDNEEYAGVLQLEFSGTFALKAIGLGPNPWHAVGTASIEFWGTHDIHVELTVGHDAAPHSAPSRLMERPMSTTW